MASLQDSVVELSSKPHQPRKYQFPKTEYGSKVKIRRSFQASWFDKWPWLHYNEAYDTVLCFTCMRAHQQNKLQWASNADAAFIDRGYSNWKDACKKFDVHQKSKTHEEAVLKMITLPTTTSNVAESLSSQLKLEKLENRRCFMKILSSLQFLARQGMAIRGHSDEDSNFSQLLKLRASDYANLESWLQRKADKYTSHDIQNEILQVMSLHILRDVVLSIQSAPFFSIMVDETTDVSNKEQVVLCCRWVDKNFEAHEEFIGLYEIGCTEAAVLLQVIQDVLTRMNISFNKIRGQCYDGASSMSGRRSGVATRILQLEPRALYTHCYGHSLNLACSDAVKECEVMRDALDVVQEITKLVKKSPRRDSTLQTIKESMGSDDPGIRVLCPTRWTVRADALHSIACNYRALLQLWEESLDFVRETEMRTRIMGVCSYMETFRFFFGMSLGELVLRHSDNLSRTLQSPRLSAAEAQKVAKMTVKTLESLRKEDKFNLFWTKVVKKSSDLGVEDPQLPRRKTPRRYEIGNSEGDFIGDVKTHYRVIYYGALDIVVSSINDRFEQPGYQMYCRLESLLLKAANNEEYEEDLQFVCHFYGNDLDQALLDSQLGIMATSLPAMKSKYELFDLVKYFKGMSDGQKELLSQVCTLISLILVMPATNSVSERSFSTLRFVKNYLRSTMKQLRLNNVMILKVHTDRTDTLNLIEIRNEFVEGSEHRERIFGKFLDSDI